MKSQEAVDQTEGTSANVLRQESSQRGWNQINKANDWRCQAPGARMRRHNAYLSLHRRAQALRVRVKAEQSNPRCP